MTLLILQTRTLSILCIRTVSKMICKDGKQAAVYKGYYKPINVYRNGHKFAGWEWEEGQGEAVEFENTYDDTVFGEITGNTVQSGTPTPASQISLVSAGGNLVSRNADSSLMDSVVLPTLRKVTTLPDTLEYLGGGVWEHTAHIKEVVFSGTENWLKVNNAFFFNLPSPPQPYDGPATVRALCSHFVWGNADTTSSESGWFWYNGSGEFWRFLYAGVSTVEQWKAWVAAQYATTPLTVIYQLATPVVTQLDLGRLKTIPRFTRVEQSGTVKGNMNLTVRVVEV